MTRNVLIVDDDREMLLSLKGGLDKYGETFSVLLAGDGVEALEKIKGNTVSIVVTDLKMPRMDGFALLTYIMENYPDIPVIIITAYSTPNMERMATKGGAVAYIQKPFMVESLARRIVTTLRSESDGGTLHGISSGTFLQLIEMERKTCTIRVTEKSSGKQGVFFFREGDLLDARSNGLRGKSAVYEIFLWDEVVLSIKNSCPTMDRKITGSLQVLLLEAMRLKDEADQKKGAESKSDQTQRSGDRVKAGETEKPDTMDMIQSRLEVELGARCRLEDIFRDTSWDDFVSLAEDLGDFFGGGSLKVCYIDRGEWNDFILLPSEETVVLSVSPKCPRDRIIEILHNWSTSEDGGYP